MKYRIIGCTLFTLCIAMPVWADRGVIVTEQIALQEPAQRAILAHNGTWELLILQTDIKADKPTKVVEFMPLPSTPEVSLAQDACFKNLQGIIDRHNLQYIVEFADRGIGDPPRKTEGVRVVAKHELGPHHLTIVKIEDVREFESWVGNFFKDQSIGQPIFTDELKEIVEDYFQRGFHFLAFDVIDIPRGRKTVAPVAYQFKCDHVYYPLKVTNLYGGKGTVEIFYVLNPWCDPHAEGPNPYDFYPRDKNAKRWIFTREVHVPTGELTGLHPVVTKLFHDAGASLFAIKYDGNLVFDKDIWLNLGYLSPEYLCWRFISLLQEGDIESLEFLVTTPFALNRQKIFSEPHRVASALQELTRKYDLKSFKIKNGAYWTGEIWNEFDREFIEKHLKGTSWRGGKYYYASEEISLHFIVYRPKESFGHRVTYFRIEKLDDH